MNSILSLAVVVAIHSCSATSYSVGRAGIAIEPFYIGPGFATIRNFTPGQDKIQLPSRFLENFLVFPINNNQDLAIQTNGVYVYTNRGTEISSFDTIAVIEGGGNLSLNQLGFFSVISSLLG
jgi:hypothetical protein